MSPRADDFVVGSVWHSPYSGYVWLVLTVARFEDSSFGTCLILGQDQDRYFSFPTGSTAQWDSQLSWCNSSKRIT